MLKNQYMPTDKSINERLTIHHPQTNQHDPQKGDSIESLSLSRTPPIKLARILKYHERIIKDVEHIAAKYLQPTDSFWKPVQSQNVRKRLTGENLRTDQDDHKEASH